MSAVPCQCLRPSALKLARLFTRYQATLRRLQLGVFPRPYGLTVITQHFSVTGTGYHCIS